MNKEEWEVEKTHRKDALSRFEAKHAAVLGEVGEMRERLKAFEAKHAAVLAEHERLREEAARNVPKGHVRCQHNIVTSPPCHEIAPRKPLPEGWVENMTGGVYFCPAHAAEVREIDKISIEAPLHRQPEILDLPVERR